MGVIAFAVELGGGFGHIKRCLPIARAAAQLGHRPLFVVTNADESAIVLDSDRVESVAAPAAGWRARARSGGIATSYADILGQAGFDDADVLRDATAAWDRLLAQLRPLAVVSELSPFLNLALHGSDVPLLVVGYGFALPPPHLPAFPRLLDRPPLFDEARLLETVASVCRQRGSTPPRALPVLFDGHAHAVTGFAELDPYSAQRQAPPVGPPALESSLARAEPTEHVFAYLLGDAPVTLDLLRVLGKTRLRGRAFIRRGTAAHRDALAHSGIAYLERPLPINEALERARLIVHHGSMLTSEEALVAGRPQLVAPLYLEHLFTARALENLGVASIVRPASTAERIASVLSAALDHATTSDRAARYAQTFWRDSPPQPDLAMQLLRRVVPG